LVETEVQSAAVTTERANPFLAVAAAVLGWFVPGLGHALLQRWVKAVIYFLAVAILAITGIIMRGNVFHSNGADAFEILGFVADLGNGICYFLAPKINPAGADVAHAAGDYGTRLIASAGVLNVLCVLEAFEIGLYRREPDKP
jgi:hypothetical protein